MKNELSSTPFNSALESRVALVTASTLVEEHKVMTAFGLKVVRNLPKAQQHTEYKCLMLPMNF